MDLKELYEYMEMNENEKIFFEPPNEKNIFKKFHEKVIEPFANGDLSKEEESNRILIELISIEREVAFKIGFNTAVQLLISSLS